MVLRQRARLLWSGKVDTTRYELDITFAVQPVRAWQLSFERVEDRELRLLSLVAGTARRPAVDAPLVVSARTSPSSLDRCGFCRFCRRSLA